MLFLLDLNSEQALWVKNNALNVARKACTLC